MKFPKDATKSERQMKWPKIAEIKDADFGFEKTVTKSTGIRFTVRCVLLNEENEMCIIRSSKYGYMQIPGGGIDDGENIEESLRREILEEAGWEISDIKPVGYICEHRQNAQHQYSQFWIQSIDFVFSAKLVKYVGTHYMQDEQEEGFEPIWVPPGKMLQFFEDQVGHKKSYSGNFANMRDLQILKYFIK